MSAFLLPLLHELDPVIFITSAHNRKEVTEATALNLDTLCGERTGFRFLVLETSDQSERISGDYSHGCVVDLTSEFFWCDTMRYALSLLSRIDLGDETRIVFLNDDTNFESGVVFRQLDCHRTIKVQSALIGCVTDGEGRLRYGLKKSRHRWNRLSLTSVPPEKTVLVSGDTFNCNFAVCFLRAVLAVDAFPATFRQAGGDYDLGFKLADSGVSILLYHEPVGLDTTTARRASGAAWSAKNLPISMWAYMVFRYSSPLLWLPLLLSPYLKHLIGVRRVSR